MEGGREGGRNGYRSNKRGLWHLFFSAHTKAAYYLILHAKERGTGMWSERQKKQDVQ